MFCKTQSFTVLEKLKSKVRLSQIADEVQYSEMQCSSYEVSKSRARSGSVTVKGLALIKCFGFRIKANIVFC